MSRRVTVALAAVALLAAVAVVTVLRRDGDGSGGPPIEEDSIVMLGDSITAEGEWERRFPEAPIVNDGRPGFTTAQLVPVAERVAAAMPTSVYVLTGTNDIRDDLPPEWTAGHLRELLDRLAASPDTQVVVQTVLPRHDGTEAVEAINQVIEQVAAEAGVEVLDLHADFDDGSGTLRRGETTDGIHLTDAGYERWVAALQPLIAASGAVGNER